MKNLTLISLFGLVLVTATTAFAGNAVLRVSCSQRDSGTKIYINNTFKGECPVDIFLPAGSVKLRAHRMVDPEHEQTFTTQLTLIAGVAKRVDVRLSQPQFTPKAQKAHDLKVQQQKEQVARQAKLQQEKAAKEARLLEAQAAKTEIKAANSGDLAAMASLAQRYETGKGVTKDPVKASSWKNKIKQINTKKATKADLQAAQDGNIKAMESMAIRYKKGDGVKMDTSKANIWQEKAKQAKERAKQQKIVKKQREAAAKTRARIESQKKGISYTKNINSLDGGLSKQMKKGPLDALFVTTISPLFTGVATILDLISSPTRTAEIRKLNKQLPGHASAWAKPYSMMAKAYRHQQTTSTAKETLILAAR